MRTDGRWEAVRGEWAVAGAVLGLALLLGFGLGQGALLIPLGLASVAAATWLAYRASAAAGALALLLTGGLATLQMTSVLPSDLTSVGAGVRLEDVILVGMLLASTVRLATRAGRRRVGRILYPTLALGAWLFLETIRNVPVFGLSAPGEFRFRYLVLAIPLSLILGLERRVQVIRLLRAFCLIAVGIPLAVAPFVLAVNGIAIGPTNRVFPAEVSLGVLLGLTVLWKCRSLLRLPGALLWSATVFGVIEILVDAHRSVWLAALAIGLALFFGGQRSRSGVRVVVGLLLAGGVAVATAGYLGLDVLSIVLARGGAALGMQDTAAWRLYVWQANLDIFRESPLIGRGLGLYWETYVPQLRAVITVFPHSAYVMTLVHLGAAGFGLFGWLTYSAWSLMRSRAKALMCRVPQWGSLVGMGIAVLAGAAAYSVAYSFDHYSLTLLGACLAVATWEPEGAEVGVPA